MLRFHGWSLSKDEQNNKNGFRQGRFPLQADIFENDENMESENYEDMEL